MGKPRSDDEIMDDDRYLKRFLMPLDLLADKRIDAKTKFIAAITPDDEDIQKSWDQSPENMISVPFPNSIFRGLEIEQCLILGFVSHKHLNDGLIPYETSLSKLSKALGMKSVYTYKHLNVLIKSGFMKKNINGKKLSLTIDVPDKFEGFEESYKGTKTIKMRTEDFYKDWDSLD